MSKAKQEIKAFDQESTRLSTVRRGFNSPEEAGFSSREEYEKAGSEHKANQNRIDEMKAKYEGARNEYQTAVERLTFESDLNSESNTTSAVSEIRSVGASSSLNGVFSGASDHVDKMTEVYNHLPTDWSDALVASGGNKINDLGPNGRAFYRETTNEISVPTHVFSSTLYHEVGHKVEKQVPGVHDKILEFYNRRTNGQASVKLVGAGYANWEVTKTDSFVDAYIGKDYGRAATEVLSMGLQYAYTDNYTMMSDPDMAQTIYGILAIM